MALVGAERPCMPAAASEWNETLATLDDKVSRYIGGNPIRLDGKPRASGVLDTVRRTEVSFWRAI